MKTHAIQPYSISTGFKPGFSAAPPEKPYIEPAVQPP